MITFSQRMGLTPTHKETQTESLDDETRNQIWSVIYQHVLVGINSTTAFSDLREVYCRRFESIWCTHLKLSPNTVSRNLTTYPAAYIGRFEKVIQNAEWYKVFDFLEYVINNVSYDGDLIKSCNSIFERESVGYRIIDKQITPVTSPVEVEAITAALSSPYESVNSHLIHALGLLSDRVNPDYRNSIKESISAVESLCKTISQKTSGTLGDCLNIIQQSHPMHKAFKNALSSLYGYTSDEGGIRHALTEASIKPTFADAKFMLVSCTAFINFLLTIAAEENIQIDL